MLISRIRLKPEQKSDIVEVIEPTQISYSVLENLAMLGYQERGDFETEKGFLTIYQREIDRSFLARYLPKTHVVDAAKKTSSASLITGEYSVNVQSDLEQIVDIIEERRLTKWMGRNMGSSIMDVGLMTTLLPGTVGMAVGMIFFEERFWSYVGQLVQRYGQWEVMGGIVALLGGLVVAAPVFNRVGRLIDRRRTREISDEALNYRYGKIAEQKLLKEIDTAKIYETSTKQPYSQIPLDIFRELQAKAMEA